jgi:hypothetical protein
VPSAPILFYYATAKKESQCERTVETKSLKQYVDIDEQK